MAIQRFIQHSVEVNYEVAGKVTKQTLPNLRESVSSQQMVALGVLFSQLAPTDMTVTEIVTVKRTGHQPA